MGAVRAADGVTRIPAMPARVNGVAGVVGPDLFREEGKVSQIYPSRGADPGTRFRRRPAVLRSLWYLARMLASPFSGWRL